MKEIETIESIDQSVKLAIYRFFAREAARPSIDNVAADVGLDAPAVAASYSRLVANRVLVVEEDGASIRMAPPFSGVPTQHVAEADGREYFANCAWDVLGVIAALGLPGTVHSRCEQSREAFRLEVGADGPEPSAWLFHTAVAPASWWDDIVFT